jgi:cytochrome c biogenesis protein CcmG, thiol:disulfide interchange protein DsbE
MRRHTLHEGTSGYHIQGVPHRCIEADRAARSETLVPAFAGVTRRGWPTGCADPWNRKKRQMRSRAIATLCAWMLLAGCDPGAIPRAPEVGSLAPEYSSVTLDGQPVALEDLRGKVVLLNVWATWCAPCREEVPALQELYESYGPQGLEVVGVSVDAPGEQETIRRFVREFDVTYPIWFDEAGTVAPTFRTIGVPSTFLIDREGVITWKHLGPVHADDPNLIRALRESLAAG